MPEGDTVFRAARRLDRALSGKVLTRSDFRVPRLAEVDLSGRHVVETVARGKHLLTRIGEGTEAVTVHSHLKMEGVWHTYAPGERWRRPGHLARVLLEVDGVTAVGFELGTLELLDRAAEESAVGHLGPDLLGPDWDLTEALRRVRGEAGEEIGEALLDQRLLAGIGNVYKSELCFVAGVHPRTLVGAVPDLEALLRTAQRMLFANRERPERTLTGNTRRGQRLWVYGRGGQPCRRCGTRIEQALVGRAGEGAGAAPSRQTGRERTTYWCPACQPER